MNVDAGSVFVTVLVAFGIWGLIPRRSRNSDAPRQPNPSAPTAPRDAELAREVGVVTGLMGGTVEDAAVTKYALSRLEKPPTAYDIGVAAGIESAQPKD